MARAMRVRKTHRVGLGLLVVVGALLLLLAGTGLADQGKGDMEKKGHDAAKKWEEDPTMAAYMKAAKPGSEHELLAKSAGTWKATIKSWMDPAGEPMVSKGTEKAEMVLGGRFLQTHFEGTNMGMPFEGIGFMGYDNVRKKYVGTWCDNMGTGIMSYDGTYDPAKKELVCHGDFVDAASGELVHAKLISRFETDNLHIFEMWSPGPTGEQVKWMEIVYER